MSNVDHAAPSEIPAIINDNRLLAKGLAIGEPWRESASLPGHLADVYRAATQLLAATGNDQLTALGLDPARYRDRFRRIVAFGAAVHDLGKANDHFQGMLKGLRSGKPQGLRHEWVTVLILRLPQIRHWLLQANGFEELDWTLIAWVVSGHHPKSGRPSPPIMATEGCGTTEIIAHLSHGDFKTSLTQLQTWFYLPPFVGKLVDTPFDMSQSGSTFAQFSAAQAAIAWNKLDDNMQRLVAAAKNCLIAADVAGSALPEKLEDQSERDTWIAKAFDRKPTPGQLQKVVNVKLGANELRDFQRQVGDSPAPITLVRAGCGSGKTAAAYLWAAQQHPGRRLYFCYPTTGTATEGFRDYLYDPHIEIDADLFHGRAFVDKRIILEAGADEDDGGDELARIESLNAWSTPVVACTVDTVLGVMRNNRRGLYAWPALAGTAFVFDEIHSYDERLFGALLRFLEDVPGVPILLMTATLQNARLEALKNLCAWRKLGHPLAEIAGPDDLELLPRYHKMKAENPLKAIRDEVKAGGQVLWVCNTVKRAMEAAETAVSLGIKPLIYHSRFRYEDRVRRHKAVIEAFASRAPALAICTQVAECSLDLSATLLISDLASVPACIQRLGRVARWLKYGEATRPFIFVEPENSAPYSDADLKVARKWIDSLPVDAISQRDLAENWGPVDVVDKCVSSDSEWLDKAYATKVGDLRECGPGITVVLPEDVSGLRQRTKLAVEVALPMLAPKSLNWRTWKKVRGLLVAPPGSICYDPERGASWIA